MKKKSMVILGALGCLSFAWLNWMLIPGYGWIIVKITLPFYCALIAGGWCLGYRTSEKKSEKRVKAAEEYACTAVQSLNEMMSRSSEVNEYYRHRQSDIDHMAERNRREREKITEERKSMAAEGERLAVLQITQKANENMQARLNACEQEKSILRNQLKRKKKVIEAITAEDDEQQKEIDEELESQ